MKKFLTLTSEAQPRSPLPAQRFGRGCRRAAGEGVPIASILKTLTFALIISLSSATTYAESAAPVYDVDSMSTDANLPPEGANGEDSAPKVTSIIPSGEGGSVSDSNSKSLEQRLTQIEQQLENLKQLDVVNRLSSMQAEIQTLRGQVEEFSHQMQAWVKRERDTDPNKSLNKSALDDTISPVPRKDDEESSSALKISPMKPDAKKSEKKLLVNKTASASKNETPKIQPDNNGEQEAYQTAYNFIKSKKYNDAISSLQEMLIKYPTGQFAANAHYWLGELYSLTGENEQAATEFSTILKKYPNNSRVADAELKLGLIYATELKWLEAKNIFRKILSKYPGTSSARLAMEQLKTLKEAGH